MYIRWQGIILNTKYFETDFNLPPVQFGINSIATDKSERSFCFFIATPL